MKQAKGNPAGASNTTVNRTATVPTALVETSSPLDKQKTKKRPTKRVMPRKQPKALTVRPELDCNRTKPTKKMGKRVNGSDDPNLDQKRPKVQPASTYNICPATSSALFTPPQGVNDGPRIALDNRGIQFDKMYCHINVASGSFLSTTSSHSPAQQAPSTAGRSTLETPGKFGEGSEKPTTPESVQQSSQLATPPSKKKPFVKAVVEQQVLGELRDAFGVHMDEAEARSALHNLLETSDGTNLGELASEVAVMLAIKQSQREAEERNRPVIVRQQQGLQREVVDLNVSGDASVQMEISHLRTAMAESLKESELIELAIVPLKDRTPEELFEHFSQSQILAKCKEEVWFPKIFDRCKEEFIQLLQREKECAKWYPCVGTSEYFGTLATELQKLGGRRPRNSRFAAFLRGETKILVEGYSSFPADPGAVPPIFAELQKGKSSVETIDLLD